MNKYRPHPGAQTDFMNSKDKRDYSIFPGGSGSGSKVCVPANVLWDEFYSTPRDLSTQRLLERYKRKERNAKSKSHHNAV